MARLNNASDEVAVNDNFITATPVGQRQQRRVNMNSPSPSPSASFSSDKENRDATPRLSKQKGKSTPMAPPQRPTPDNTALSNKKRKLAEREVPNASQAAHRRQLEEVGDSRFYDPNQSIAERRKVRKEYRDLSRDLTGGTCCLSLVKNND